MRLLCLDPDGKGRLTRGHGPFAHGPGPAPRSTSAVSAAMTLPSDVLRQWLNSQEDSTWHLPKIIVIFRRPPPSHPSRVIPARRGLTAVPSRSPPSANDTPAGATGSRNARYYPDQRPTRPACFDSALGLAGQFRFYRLMLAVSAGPAACQVRRMAGRCSGTRRGTPRWTPCTRHWPGWRPTARPTWAARGSRPPERPAPAAILSCSLRRSADSLAPWRGRVPWMLRLLATFRYDSTL